MGERFGNNATAKPVDWMFIPQFNCNIMQMSDFI
jgi:hypothetical protein